MFRSALKMKILQRSTHHIHNVASKPWMTSVKPMTMQMPKTQALNLANSTITRSIKGSASIAHIENVAANRSIAYWLFGCAGMVAGMVVIGGATRITRSGLSMVDWKPQGSLPPLSAEEWEVEFEKYKKFPEYQQRQDMTVDEFKGIFWWEYGHRMLGRVLGVAFAGPLTYFMLRKRIPKELYRRLGTLFALGATQGGIGWWMVKSGLEDVDTDTRKEIRVSPYRLATHLGFAFTTYSLLLWTGFEILNPKSKLALQRDMVDAITLSKASGVRKIAHATAAILGFTILSGAFVAGTDAGKAYNTFPKMGDNWIPEEAFTMEPFYKNFFEEVATVQLDHRVLAFSTLTGVLTMYGKARNGHVWNQLPSTTKNALNTTLVLAGTQVSLGITAILTCCQDHVAVTHQAGSLALLSSVLWTLHSLRFTKAVPSTIKKVL